MRDDLSSRTPTVLFVDDDLDVLTSARMLLDRHGWNVILARSPAEGWSQLASEPVDVVLLDLNFSPGSISGAEGLNWLTELHAHDPALSVVVVTGHSGINVAVQSMKCGASDFLMKPWSNARLLDVLDDAIRVRRRRTDPNVEDVADRELLLLGDSFAIDAVRERLARAARTGAPVLLRGAAGSGKSLAARLLHARSPQAEASLVVLDLRDGDRADWADVFERAIAEAQGGVLLLDEIAALAPQGQAQLLRRLEAAGNIRLISTSRALNLAETRDDLMAKFNTIEIVMPPLSERADDAVLLTEHFVRIFSRRAGLPPKPLDPAAAPWLKSGALAGQVRGLRQAAERAVAMSDGDLIQVSDLAPQPSLEPSASPGGGDLNLARSEKAVIKAALKRHAHNISVTARALGLTRAALYRRMLKHDL